MKLKLITAILMTMATIAWLASALLVPHSSQDTLMRWGIVAIFTVLAIFYWRAYFRMKNSDISRTE